MNTNDMNTPEELKGMESAVEALGAAERASAPERLEQGVFLASWRELSKEGDAPVIRVRAWGRSWGRAAIAAAVLVVSGVAATFMGRGTGPGGVTVASTNGLEDAVNFVLDLRTSNDDLALLGDKIDTLILDAGTVSESLQSDPATVLMGDGAL